MTQILNIYNLFYRFKPGVTYSFIVYDETTRCYYFKQAEAPTQTLSTLDIAITPANVTCQGAGNGKVSFTLSDFNVATSHVKYKVFNSQTNVEYLPAIAGMVTKASAIADLIFLIR
ncbi:hypothetical protein BXU11_16605 [Flavobacterium sp. LM5]|uniref:hypothetical protein n=1 Tax=Flavobacterium sp. LM5 TaxID=1938610 RepID=UPI000991A781|nr:hypothetical protein [Flavobacterium sp. LM5]OOV21843.1 hypothetical protein BXU11_16605 [Flavobacterium sp. LM5]